ncbi:MAG: DUF2284 domain-containing protein [Clostridiales bacterium]|nr:DUF2284 domain-containing protein [Clostridiales bacterium]
MTDIKKIIEKALKAGFSDAAPLDLATLELREDVRAACAENKCGQYGKNWTCPPACGTLDDFRKLISDYKQGIIVQTYGELEDEFDFETTMELEKRHRQSMEKLANELSGRYSVLALGAGACRVCQTCSYPNPCVNEKRRISSMESLGLMVSDVCKKNHVEYYHGKGTQTFVGCFLIGD